MFVDVGLMLSLLLVSTYVYMCFVYYNRAVPNYMMTSQLLHVFCALQSDREREIVPPQDLLNISKLVTNITIGDISRS